MLDVIFTLDYEIHGNGDGNPTRLMVRPTASLIRLFDEFGAKLTIMADVAEILRFRDHAMTTGRDGYSFAAIVDQLCAAVRNGHDVQLHIHSSYFNAEHENDHWRQDWSEYDFAALPYDRISWMIDTCKQFLESMLKPVRPDYQCIAFRAANWSVSPSSNVVRALVDNGILIDTSVFKYGQRRGPVVFDYSHAHSHVLPWRASEGDICKADSLSPLWEVPIYAEPRPIGVFLTAGRLRQVLSGASHRLRPTKRDVLTLSRAERGVPVCSLLRPRAWKADFNQCRGRQLVGALERAALETQRHSNLRLPFVLIGHSKLFGESNARSLKPFLSHVRGLPARFGFDTLLGASRHRTQWEAL
jgi:hypothetical protein